MQNMLDLTKNISGKYHVEFGGPKSNAIKIGDKTRPEFWLRSMILDYCEKYKYL